MLDALAGSAAREASRVAVLLVRGDGLRAWRFVGFGLAYDAAKDIDVPKPLSQVKADRGIPS